MPLLLRTYINSWTISNEEFKLIGLFWRRLLVSPYNWTSWKLIFQHTLRIKHSAIILKSRLRTLKTILILRFILWDRTRVTRKRHTNVGGAKLNKLLKSLFFIVAYIFCCFITILMYRTSNNYYRFVTTILRVLVK